MSKNGTAQKVQKDDFLKSHLLVVTPDTKAASAKVINFQSVAEDTASEPITEEQKPQEVKPQEVKAEVIESAPVQAAPEAKPIQSIEDIKRKSEVLNRLTVKWDALTEKRRKVENFAISHDGDTTSAIVRDAQGEVFESNSPKTIGKLIEFWKAEFSEAIAIVEKEMREIA